MLSVKVITDGPTRVLQVTDISQQVSTYSVLQFFVNYFFAAGYWRTSPYQEGATVIQDIHFKCPHY